MKVGVLASGTGSNLQALLDRLHGHEIEVVGVASDKPAAPALERARGAGVEAEAFPLGAFADRAARDDAVAGWLEARGAELVVLAGYMAILTPAFLARFAGRVVNVHPSLLPAFPGIRAVEQALDYGVSLFGVTVHLVDDGVDTGPVLRQRSLELPDARSAAEVLERLHPIEHDLLCEVVAAFARGEVRPDPTHPRRMLGG